jgi:hypothetical protein
MNISWLHRLLVLVVNAAILFTIALTSQYVFMDQTIVDVSWPNCTYVPRVGFGLGIIGVTGGLNLRPNPCLVHEAAWFEHYAAYMNTGYPGTGVAHRYRSVPYICTSTQLDCLAYNYGFHAATYALQYAASQNVHSRLWWLDVETENSWSSDPQVNIADLQGAIDAVREQSFALVGFYSTPNQWRVITGGWRNGLPAWMGTGELSRVAASSACRAVSFTGGSIWLSQYTIVLDQNVSCSSAFGRTMQGIR